ncbi:Mitochondrial import receptor subunit tom70 (72 kDa mitochondrial outer membrane protein) (Mitochondrial import receptor for the ADP/ATP carrier) (Mitochondrial precursor proteins import receptor) (Translocase of outer membrane tom70) [Durusdinium trenchii]|uniref:Tetratricopeptide repeat protein n=1 Tax=Durusdinium trenchii TaxID=1381693 RepID=A0ABP0SJT6_9DINO
MALSNLAFATHSATQGTWRESGISGRTRVPQRAPLDASSSRRHWLVLLGFAGGLAGRPGDRRACRAESALTEEQKLAILKEVQSMGDIAVSAPTVEEEEAAWTRMLDRFAGLPDIEVRVRCNRGNSLARQGKLQEALADYNRAIELVPNAPDPHLNRGAVYESLGRLEDALKDYDVVLQDDPGDPAAWNNRGNALLGLQRFEEAKDSFQQALDISGSQQFAFAGVNLAIAQYELKEDAQAVQTLRKLLARYAEAFPDARAAYALVLWDQGERVEAESQWDRATSVDPRYRQAQWVSEFRRWPPRLMSVFRRFSETTSVKVKP